MDEKGAMPKTMFEKIWDAHAVREAPGETTILYIDRHLVHEMTSAQAFAGLRTAGIPVRRPAATIAVLDHGVPTVPGRKMINVVDKRRLSVLPPWSRMHRTSGSPYLIWRTQARESCILSGQSRASHFPA